VTNSASQFHSVVLLSSAAIDFISYLVHVMMLSVHAVAGRPLHFIPGTRPLIMVLSLVYLSLCI